MLQRILAATLVALTLALPVFAATPVNVNKADAATIADALDGIGMTKAKAIVAYRDAHGPFKSVDELGEVKGIGHATLERNRQAILLSDSGAKAQAADAPTTQGSPKGGSKKKH